MAALRSTGARPVWAWVRLAGGTAILLAVLWQLGTGPVLAGLHRISPATVLVALASTGLTTVCAAWRWRIIATGLGVRLSLRDGVYAYYRSQFLNTVLPGGILGDVHRAVDHGHRTGDLGRAARAVVWERSVGQVVQAGLTVAVLLGVGWPSRPRTLLGLGIILVGMTLLTGLLRHRWRQVAWHELRAAVLTRTAWPRIVVASVVVVTGHTAVLFIAARSSGVTTSNARLIALSLLVLLATSVPLNVAGWGPREGAAAWLFGAAGLGAAAGLSAATIDGVLVFLACLPGAIVLIVAARRTGGQRAQPIEFREREQVGSRG